MKLAHLTVCDTYATFTGMITRNLFLSVLLGLSLCRSELHAAPVDDYVNTLDATALEVYGYICKQNVPPAVWAEINRRWTYTISPQQEELIRSDWLIQLAGLRLKWGDKQFCGWLRNYISGIR